MLFRSAFALNPKLVLVETPSNPLLRVVDVADICVRAHAVGAKVVVDNVFATPIFQKPLELGADVVVYSATKHIDGQGRVLGGAILTSEAINEEFYRDMLRHTGPSLSPFNAWVMLKGLETLALRVEKQTANAARLADVLASTPGIARVIYPGRADHPNAAIVKKQMRGGSNLIALEVEGGKAGAFAFSNALEVVKISNNLGDAKSLITHPATTTHQRLKPEVRAELGISDGLLRLSVGLEDVEDLIEDVTGAAAAARRV